MGNFKSWLISEEIGKDFNFYKNLIISKLNLDEKIGLTQSINTWEPQQLISILEGLGEFKELTNEVQQQVIGQIKSGMGTLGDLIKLMSS